MIDRSYAPQGCIAVSYDSCWACKSKHCETTTKWMCADVFRPDKEHVRFARRPTVILNTTGKPPRTPEWAKQKRIWFRDEDRQLLALVWVNVNYALSSYELNNSFPTIATEFR